MRITEKWLKKEKLSRNLIKNGGIKMNIGEFVQQGDVLIERISGVPEEAKKIKTQDIHVIAHGEGGHSHVLKDTQNTVLYENDYHLYLTVKVDSVVTHEEHKPITLPPADY